VRATAYEIPESRILKKDPPASFGDAHAFVESLDSVG
jgi:hypothetical protein